MARYLPRIICPGVSGAARIKSICPSSCSRVSRFAAIGGSLDSRDYNLDAYSPLKTLRQRVGDLVIKHVGGDFRGEWVELSQITISIDNIDDPYVLVATHADAAA